MISIIIPTYNRYDQLQRTMQSLMRLKTDQSLYEIIIIDNGSTDSTATIVQEFINVYNSKNIYYYFDDTPGLLTGRHLGVEKSNGDILTFIDDDVQVSSTWLDTISSEMNLKKEVCFLTGPSLPLFESYPPSWLVYFWKNVKNGKSCTWLSLLDLGNNVQEISPNYVWGLNFTIRKSTFLELGGFHPDCIPSHLQMFQGDGETGLTMKGIEKGIKALYHPGVLVYHEVPNTRLTFDYFEKRAYYNGVSESYYKIRLENNLYNKEINHSSIKQSQYTKMSLFFRNKIKKLLLKNKKNRIPIEVINLKNNLAIKNEEGFQYHQNQYNNSLNLKKWVLNQNYFDYKLPIL